MKKFFVLTVAMLLCLVLVLAACNNTVATTATPRWENGEEYSFVLSKISLENNDVAYNGEKYLLEPVATNYELNPSALDQVEPANIGGTYTMKIALTADERECTYTTSQVMFAQYATSLLQSLSIWNDLKAYVAADDENPLPAAEGCTTLKSVTTTKVVFKNEAAQTPKSSETHVDGFYIGKANQNISKYDVSTVYDWDKKVATVTLDENGKHNVTEVSLKKVTKLIDANQMMLYVRSLEKTSDMFKDGPSVQVLVPYTSTITTASFVFTYSCNAMLRNGSDFLFAKVNAVAAIVEGAALFVQLNVPETVNANGRTVDVIPNGGSLINRYTMLRFRAGLVSYDPASYNADLAAALEATSAK